MNETMVERVAKAIEPETFALPRINLNRDVYERAYRRARAAIEAMRFSVGASSVPGGLAIEESMFASEDTVFHGAAKSFNAILDAALATPPEG